MSIDDKRSLTFDFDVRIEVVLDGPIAEYERERLRSEFVKHSANMRARHQLELLGLAKEWCDKQTQPSLPLELCKRVQK